MFWLITARVLDAPMPVTPTVAMLTEIARRLKAAPEHVPRDDHERRRSAGRGLHELTA